MLYPVILLMMTLQIGSERVCQYTKWCVDYRYCNFWEVCGGCGLCQIYQTTSDQVNRCDYTFFSNIFIPESHIHCALVDGCEEDGCKNLPCVPMLGTFKCVCNSKNIGRLCQYNVKPRMSLKDYAVLENFLYTPYFTFNEYMTVSLMFSSLGSRDNLLIVIVTLTERLTYNWKACRAVDRSGLADYCLSAYTRFKQFCDPNNPFKLKNVKWLFEAKIPFPGRAFEPEERLILTPGNTTDTSTALMGYVESVKLEIYNKKDANPVFETEFIAAHFTISEHFSVCEPFVINKEGGATTYDVTKFPKGTEILIETLYIMPSWYENCISRIEDLHVEWTVWVYDINHNELGQNFFMKKFQVEYIKFEKYSIEHATYKLRTNVTIWQSGKEGFSTAYSYFEVVLLELEPAIQGGYSRSLYYKNVKVVINGSLSRNPNLSLTKEVGDLVYYWECDKGQKMCSGKYTDENYITYYGPFLANEIYTFTLTIISRMYNIRKRALQQIIIVADPSPTLEIICRKNCGGFEFKSNPAETTYLEVSIVDVPVAVKRNDEFIWTYRTEKEEGFKDTENIRQPNTPNNVLIVLPNTLLKGETYFFQAKGGSNVPAEAQFKLKMATSIASFSCNVTMISSTKGFFGNAITCDRLLFDNLSPTYEYYDRFPNKPDDKGRLIGATNSNTVKQVSFVRGKLVVEVTNQYGIVAATENNLELTPETNAIGAVNELVKQIKFYHSTMDSEYKANIVSAIVDMIYYEKESFRGVYADIIERLLFITDKEEIESFKSLKTWVLAMDVLATEGAETVFRPQSVRYLSRIIMTFSEKLKFYLTLSDNIFYDFTTGEILQLVQSMVNICDKIYYSKSEGLKDEFYSRYRESTSDTFRAIETIMSSLKKIALPFLQPFIVKGKKIKLWLKEDTPIYFSKLSSNQTLNESIPSVIMSKVLANDLKRSFSSVNMQVVVFDENPFWWQTSVVINTNVVDLKLSGNRGDGEVYITRLRQPIQINLDYREAETSVINGRVRQPDASGSLDIADNEVDILKIRVEERGILKLKFLGLKEGEAVKVLALLNMRPDYLIMIGYGHNATKSHPEYMTELLDPNSEDIYDLYYLGILPGHHVQVGGYMNYSLELTILRCVSWHYDRWISRGCDVKDIIPASKQLHCECKHLTSFAGFAGVPMNTVNPFEDYKLLIHVVDNPYVALFVVCLLILYFILLFYTVRKDRRDKYKQCAIYLEDNLPYDKYPYLVCVQTGARLFSGTTSNVGISVQGVFSASRPHILKSTKFEALQRADDNWFIMFTPRNLGEIKLIHIWIDYSGHRPDWYCNKIVVVDLTEKKDYTFLVNSWLSLKLDNKVEKFEKTATQEEIHREDLASDNLIYGFRETHMWMSVVSKHPRSGVNSSQRLSLAFCGLFAAMLTSCMFYKVDEQQEDYPEYQIAEKEIIISVCGLIISALITNTVTSVFRKRLIIFEPDDNEEEGKEEEISVKPSGESVAGKRGKRVKKREGIFVRTIQHIFRVLVSKKKFVPVHLEVDVLKKAHKRPLQTICFEACAWSICIFVIVFCAYLVILYGLKFGKIKSLEWLSSNVMSVVEEVFVASPVKIIAVAVLSGILFSNIFQVIKYDVNWDVILKYKKHLLKTHEELIAKLLVLRSKPMYAPLSHTEIAKKRKKCRKHAYWVLPDFIIIGIFAAILIIQSGTMWTTRYYWNNLQLRSLLKRGYKEEGFQLHELQHITGYLPFLEKDVIPFMYQLKWYNGLPIRDELNSSEFSQTFALSATSSIFGLPRLRQRRQLPGLCRANSYRGLPDMCPNRLTEETEDTELYAEGWTTGPYETFVESSPWNYKEPEEGYELIAFGYNSLTYNGGGYVAYLTLSLDASEDVIRFLIREKWLNNLTSIAFYETTLYNPNTGTLSVLIAVTERLYIGLLMNKLYVYTLSQQYDFPTSDFVVLASLIVFTIRVLLEFNRSGIKTEAIHFWNVLEITIVCLGICCVFLYVKTINHMKNYVEEFRKRDRDKYVDFIPLVTDLTYIQLIMMTLVVVMGCRFLISFKFVSVFYVAYHTVVAGWRTLLWISVLIIVIIFIYWSVICYFLNSFILSRAFLIILLKLDFRDTAKNCGQQSCRIGLYIVGMISDVFTLLIAALYLHLYKKIKNKKREENKKEEDKLNLRTIRN